MYVCLPVYHFSVNKVLCVFYAAKCVIYDFKMQQNAFGGRSLYIIANWRTTDFTSIAMLMLIRRTLRTTEAVLYLRVVPTHFAFSALQSVVIVVGLLVVPFLYAGRQVNCVTLNSVQVLSDVLLLTGWRLTVNEVAACRPRHRQRLQKIIPSLPHHTFVI